MCACDEWAKKLAKNPFTVSAYSELAVTFQCPDHGTITLDARPIPAPELKESEFETATDASDKSWDY